MNMISLHRKQNQILRKLVQVNGQKYSQLYKHFDEEDRFPYHLKFLVNKKLINKREGRYFLTNLGMQQTAYFDSRKLNQIPYKMLYGGCVCKFKDKYFINNHFGNDDSRENLYCLPSVNLIFGRKLLENAEQELIRKFKFQSKCSYRSTVHMIDYTSNVVPLFDNICIVFDAQVEEADEADHHWKTIDEIKDLSLLHPLVERFIIQNEAAKFSEISFVNNYGFEEIDHI